MDRVKCIDSAKEIITKDRQNTYGKPEDNFKAIARLWSIYLDTSINSTQVATMMVLLKVARQKTSPHHEDNYVDIAGYAACAAELAEVHYGAAENCGTI